MQVISWNLGPETVPSKTLVPSHPYDLDFRTVFLTYRPSPMEEAAVGGCHNYSSCCYVGAMVEGL